MFKRQNLTEGNKGNEGSGAFVPFVAFCSKDWGLGVGCGLAAPGNPWSQLRFLGSALVQVLRDAGRAAYYLRGMEFPEHREKFALLSGFPAHVGLAFATRASGSHRFRFSRSENLPNLAVLSPVPPPQTRLSGSMLLASLPRLLARPILALGFVLAAAPALLAQTSSPVDGFDPDVDGNVLVLAMQPDGRLLVGGQFSTVSGFPRRNLARLNADGSLDPSFNPSPDAAVRAIVLQPDDRIVIGGDFTSLQPGGAGAVVNRGRIARVTSAGAIDTAFNPNVSAQVQGVSFQCEVDALLLQPNGQIVAGGSFTTVQPGGAGAAVARNYLARFNADGSLDAGFNPNPNAVVLALALHVGNKIVVGGGFTTVGGATRNRIARLNANGTIDSEFNPNANNGVTTLAVQRDGKILLGGFFTTVQPIGEENAANRPHLARLNADGSVDSEFYPRAEGNVSAIALQPDGSILIGGPFNGVWGRGTTSIPRGNVARFNPDGSLDTDFTPTLNAEVNAFAFQPDGKVIVGGHFTRFQLPGAATATVRNHLARLDAAGSLDTSFALDAGGRILVSVTQSDGKVVVGGTFTSAGGATHNYVARLNADGSIDPTYNPDFNGRVYAMAYEAGSNKVIVGGEFTKIGGEVRNHIARLNPSGTIDSEFNPNLDGQVGAIALQTDGKILVSGSFSNVQPLGSSTPLVRHGLLRLNANGTLDTAFHPNPNSTVSTIALQSDGSMFVGGLFTAFTDDVDLTPVTTTTGTTTTTTVPTGTTTARANLARLGADGRLDPNFKPAISSQVSAIAVQSDGKIIIAGSFTTVVGSDGVLETVTDANGNKTQVAPTRNHIARLLADGKLDATYDPNANGNVLALALQSDGKLLIGGAFTTLQPNSRSSFFLRKYAARLNSDGTLDETFNLDLSEQPGNRVDSIRIQPDGRVLIGGSFNSLQPTGSPARTTRPNFVRLAGGAVDLTFNPLTGGSTGAVVNGFAIQPDGKIVAVGSFADLGGAKSANIARFRADGTADPEFSNSLSTAGPVNAVAIRPNIAATPAQLSGFAWLSANGTLRSAFATGGTRLSGEVNAIAFDSSGRLLLGGAFANLTNSTSGNLLRFSSTGVLDPGFNPAPNGAVTGLVVQPDGRIIIVGTFTTVGGLARNRIARIDADGSVDVTYDPGANGRINALVLQSDGRAVVGGAFTSFTPNLATTAVTRNYLARINADGTVDASYDPAPNFNVEALALQGDGKVIAGGSFSSVQPNGGTAAFARNSIARFNPDGTLDQNFDPNINTTVRALVALPNGQILVGGSFATLQPNNGTLFTRNNLARINSDGAVDASFNPNPNAAVSSIALQPDGQIVIAGAFTTVQPNETGASITRNHLARITAAGALDPNFNPDVNDSVSIVVARPDGTVLVGGKFTELQLNGSIVVAGNFASVGGVAARNLAMLNENGSVNATFQPRPDGAVNALLVQPDGKIVVGGAFTSMAGATRNRIARFNMDGSLDAAFNPTPRQNVVMSLARQPDGKLLVAGQAALGGAATGLLSRLNADGSVDASFNEPGGGTAIREVVAQADGRILFVQGSNAGDMVARLNADGTTDASFTTFLASGGRLTLGVQADGRIIVGSSVGTRLQRLNPNGTVDLSFNVAVNGTVSALAFLADGRIMIGGGFTTVAGQSRVGLARVSNNGAANQTLGVAGNRSAVMWNRGGTVGEISAVVFEFSSDRVTWSPLGQGTRMVGTSNWQLTGLSLPATGLFYIRARGIAPASGASSGLYESMREFTFSSPLPAATDAIATVPATSGAPNFDPVTGIVARSAIAVVPGEGSVEIFVSSLRQLPENPQPARLANLSTRGRVSPESPLILGFAIAGTEPRRVLVRAAGPALNGFGVSGALGATRLQVYDAAGAVIAANEGWANSADAAQTAAATGAFPLTAGSADSAAVLSLAPGNYTLQVIDPRGAGGIALAEIYDAGTGVRSHLVNVSSRGAAGTGASALISGFVIAGDLSERVLLRGVGPGLAKFGAGSVVADPSIALFDAEGRELGSNDNWVSSVATVSSATANAGAFPLDIGSKDAAVLANLPAGSYTIQVSAPTTGAALLEIYEVR